jgi:hypothetical protein
MSLTCTRCEGTGFLNLSQIPESDMGEINKTLYPNDAILLWIKDNDGCDVQVCDCCGDGEGWYGIPGEHYNSEDPPGKNGPYAFNGGLCQCH